MGYGIRQPFSIEGRIGPIRLTSPPTKQQARSGDFLSRIVEPDAAMAMGAESPPSWISYDGILMYPISNPAPGANSCVRLSTIVSCKGLRGRVNFPWSARSFLPLVPLGFGWTPIALGGTLNSSDQICGVGLRLVLVNCLFFRAPHG